MQFEGHCLDLFWSALKKYRKFGYIFPKVTSVPRMDGSRALINVTIFFRVSPLFYLISRIHQRIKEVFWYRLYFLPNLKYLY